MDIDALLAVVGSPTALAVAGAVGITVFGQLLTLWIAPSERVHWGSMHGFTWPLKDQSGKPVQPVHTRAIIVQNLGRAAAEEVEVFVSMKPQEFQVWPPITHEERESTEGYFVVKFPTLGRDTFVYLNWVHLGPACPEPLGVRSKLQPAKWVEIAPSQRLKPWQVWMWRSLSLLGIAFLIYLSLVIIFPK